MWGRVQCKIGKQRMAKNRPDTLCWVLPRTRSGFWHPWKSEGAPQIDLFSVDRRLWLQKWSPRGVPERKSKNGSNNYRFFNGKTFQNYALCNEFKVFGILEKVEKSMPKWPSKVMKNRSKWHPGAARLDFIVDFMDFGPCRKIVVFWCRAGSSKNQ